MNETVNGADAAEIEGPQPEAPAADPNYEGFPTQFVGVGIEQAAESDKVNVTVAMVATTRGLMARSDLLTKLVVYEQQNAHVVAVEWYAGFGPTAELVRRDCHVSLLTGNPVGVKKGEVGG